MYMVQFAVASVFGDLTYYSVGCSYRSLGKISILPL